MTDPQTRERGEWDPCLAWFPPNILSIERVAVPRMLERIQLSYCLIGYGDLDGHPISLTKMLPLRETRAIASRCFLVSAIEDQRQKLVGWTYKDDIQEREWSIHRQDRLRWIVRLWSILSNQCNPVSNRGKGFKGFVYWRILNLSINHWQNLLPDSMIVPNRNNLALPTMYEFDWSKEATKENPMILVMKLEPDNHEVPSSGWPCGISQGTYPYVMNMICTGRGVVPLVGINTWKKKNSNLFRGK